MSHARHLNSTLDSKRTTLAAPALLMLLAAQAFAQANYAESFDGVGDGESGPGGPASLASRGWVFRNQSNPSNGISPYWSEFPGWGQVASALGHGGFTTWQNSSNRVSAWIVLPAIPSQVAGDPLAFWTSAPTNAFGYNAASLEVRYSPTGATSTGSGATDVGNFTQLLTTISGQGGHGWTRRVMNVPGTGRIAIRLVIPPASSSFDFSGSMMIDSLQVGNPAPLAYPLPSAGQTVHWTMAMSPVILQRAATGESPRIVPGGTVIVDPGVEVRLANSTIFDVSGTLDIQGTPAQPVRFRGASGSGGGWARVSVAKGGLLTAAHADVETFTDLIYGGKASFTDSAFRDPANPTEFSYDAAGDVGHRFFDGNLDYARQVLSLNRCSFGQGCSASILRGWLAARDTTFFRGSKVTLEPGAVGGEAMFIVGGSILDNVTATEAYIDLQHEHFQHRFVGNVTITGNPFGPGLRLSGGANYLVDPSVVLQGHLRPVEFGINSAGLLPGSRLPSTGNQLNEVLSTTDPAPLDEKVVWADTGVPYVENTIGGFHGQITILPGVTVKVPENTHFAFDTDSNGFAMPIFLGEPERPIRFMPYTPGTKWGGISIGNVRWYGTRWDWCIVEDSTYGSGAAELPIAYDNCVFRRNIRGIGGSSFVALRKCTFENNVYSYNAERFAPNHVVEGPLDANHPSNPNTFINNNGNPGEEYQFSFLPNGGLIARSRHNSLESTDSDVRNNWWGTPTGPRHPTFNPNGQGDDVFFGIDAGGYLLPYLTEAPTSNPPPVVRGVTPALYSAIPGEVIHFQWTARDDGRITSQRVYYSPRGNFDAYMQLLAEIPADARSFEFRVPNIGTDPSSVEQYFRVVSVDDLGQEGLADMPFIITNPGVMSGTLAPSPAVTGTFVPGSAPSVCYFAVPDGGTAMGASIELDNDESGRSLGGMTPQAGQNCLSLGMQVPDASTDRARIRYDFIGTLNQVKSFYGPFFTIRPDALLGDAAPTITLTSSHGGQSYAGGSSIPLAWTASDDEALRSFDVRASFDGGTRWFIVARDLPADARSYLWRLPASQGVPAVKVRVVAKDRRFQNTSAESGAFSIAPGTWPTACPADIDDGSGTGARDGGVTIDDLLYFLAVFEQGTTAADLDNDGEPSAGVPDQAVDINDLLYFIARFEAGC